MSAIQSTYRYSTGGRLSPQMWVGSVSELRQLVVTCRGLEATSLAAAVEERSRIADEVRSKFDFDHRDLDEDVILSRWQEREAMELQRLQQALHLTMTVKQKRWEAVGDGAPEEVIDNLTDPLDIEEMKISLGSPHGLFPNIRHSGFSLVFDNVGVQGKFHSYKTDWVVLAAGLLTEQITRSRPWYWWLRNDGLIFSALFVPLTVFNVSVLLGAYPLSPFETALLLGGISLVAVVVYPVIRTGWRKLIPAFELTPDGAQAKGRRFLVAASGLFVWVLGTVALPLLTATWGSGN